MTTIRSLYDQQVKDTFLELLKQSRLPDASELRVSAADFSAMFEAQATSRIIDHLARVLRRMDLGFYTIGSAGHEGNAVFGSLLAAEDDCCLHYRSGALVTARMMKFDKEVIEPFVLSLMCDKRDPIASGRHKVFGDVELNISPQTSTVASHLPKAVGIAFSYQKLLDMGFEQDSKQQALTLCSFGDASTNHATALSAFNLTKWICQKGYPLPLVFLCEDNGYGISTPTPESWIFSNFSDDPYLEYIQVDGRDINQSYSVIQAALESVRREKKPLFIHFKCVRLYGHAGSDAENTYLSDTDIAYQQQHDPLLYSASLALKYQLMSLDGILQWYDGLKNRIIGCAESLQPSQLLSSAEEIKKALHPQKPSRIKTSAVEVTSLKKSHMASLINQTLDQLCQQFPQMILLGEDIGRKGGVYGVTAGLQGKFSKKRVMDTLLDETSILGMSIGMSMQGLLPVPEIQFLAYLHNAIDQLRSEAATLSFFSNGQFSNPMVIRIPAFAYQSGIGGHFHNENVLAPLRDIPGIHVVSPSCGEDAVKCLRGAVNLALQGQIVVFLEPIAMYFKKDILPGDKKMLATCPPADELYIPGQIGVEGRGKCAILSYANGMHLARIAKAKTKKPIRLIDIRWLHPLPTEQVLEALDGVEHLIVVDECRKGSGIAESVVTLIHLHGLPIKLSLLQGEDCFITTGPSQQHLLPSIEAIEEQLKRCK